MKRKPLDYLVLDVFANESYKGNPLAVVFADSNLNLEDYKNIAREFGYSETSFVSIADKKTLQIRSFTPIGFEVDGAGHNVLGAVNAAIFKSWIDFPYDEIQYVKVKKTAVPIIINENKAYSLPIVKMLQKPAFVGNPVPIAEVANALGTWKEVLQMIRIQPIIVQTEVAHLMVPMPSVEILNNLKPNNKLLIELSKRYHFEGFYCFVLAEQNETNIAQSRFFNPLIGIDEDAATGTAAGPLAGLLLDKGMIQSNRAYQILQGVKLNMPSLIEVIVKHEGVLVGGSSIVTMEGQIYLNRKI